MILGNMVIKIESGVASFTASDLEIQVSSSVDCESEKDCEFSLPARKLLEILNALSGYDKVIFTNISRIIPYKGHLFLIETMVRHFEIIPLGLNQLSDQTGQAIISGGSMMFLKGLQFAAPAMIMLLLIDTGIGFMARVMPQMNIFFVALPIKIGVGIIMLIFSVNIFQSMFDVIFNDLTIITNELISSFRI